MARAAAFAGEMSCDIARPANLEDGMAASPPSNRLAGGHRQLRLFCVKAARHEIAMMR